MSKAQIVGWAHSPFGKSEFENTEEPMASVAAPAPAHAGVEREDVDGHPIGATGVSMHVMAAMQLAGEAGDMQVPNAELAGVFNIGGAAVANYVSLLERAK